MSPILHHRNNAAYHCNKHVVKMIAESTQMLVTALHGANFPAISAHVPEVLANFPCKPLSASMAKHPCTQWTAKNIIHFNYLCRLANVLCTEHQHRYPLSPEHCYTPWLRELERHLDSIGIHANTELPTHFALHRIKML